ncbi:UDP-N-acetylmuramate--L-alanine ligase [Thioflexithrix psekupsensis]|uniref:UDP-N-acetylmuramate--L-alanine ligase n=1 Tax=Thioflexithrix psekupsensis TaxID=1570016 RepID=A0A251XA45_9GAMM|nr:UDP-N-acetylmuramate--L-alanine ligase [Thioflexithrix psekupsensis]OUD15054.1 UDP-N-acetylmuramate--L-alanine ligase [Thioflexithrix psekupsensis]
MITQQEHTKHQGRNQLPKRGRRIHFVGIGGAGMGGIAEVMHHIGYAVTGSDLQKNAMTRHLAAQGVRIYIGHAAENVYGCDVVVISSAVKADNPEVIAARKQHIPVIPRAEMLGELMRFRQGIAIAGTHGKTTTTSLVTSMLAEAGLDPTFVIGGRLNSTGTHASLGQGTYLVAEADESDASFLYLKPIMAVVTNIDADHMETYQHDFERLKQTFIHFLQQLPFYGLAVLCIDDPVICSVLPEITKPTLTYGFSETADVRATAVRAQGGYTYFSVSRDDSHWLDICLNLPGHHNVLNALAAMAIAHEAGVSDQAIQHALQHFSGIGRRLQMQPLMLTDDRQLLLFDDYGHHPREITAVLQAIRSGWPNRRLVVIFQPHRYSRTRDLFTDFVEVLTTVDVLFLLDVYPAGEKPIPEASGQRLYEAIAATQHVDVYFIDNSEDLVHQLCPMLHDQDILLTLGAGNISTIAYQLPTDLLNHCR